MLEVKESKDSCISCCDRDKLTKQISINRDSSSYKGANIVTISLCDDCLKKLATEFQSYC